MICVAFPLLFDPGAGGRAGKIEFARGLVMPAHTSSAGFVGPEKYLAWKLLRIAAAVDGAAFFPRQSCSLETAWLVPNSKTLAAFDSDDPDQRPQLFINPRCDRAPNKKEKPMKIITWIKCYVSAVLDCPKGVCCARCQRLNFYFDDVGFFVRDREIMCRECFGKLTGDSLRAAVDRR